VEPGAVASGRVKAADIVAFVSAHRGNAPLVYSSASPDAVAAAQEEFGRESVARSLESLFAESARALVASGVRRLVVAGGETSGAVVSALGLKSLAIGPEIDPGVPALYARESGLALALKRGNFGAPAVFDSALVILAKGTDGKH
jgi:uncharacterized protein YgbK (DUF1537 family)